jgi:CRP-like cAMP-binding protein
MILKELAYNDPQHRISALLNYFKESQRNICPTCFQLQLTRQQIADMTGLRVETVIRTMRHMHESGEVIIKKGKVYCCDSCAADMTEIIKKGCIR